MLNLLSKRATLPFTPLSMLNDESQKLDAFAATLSPVEFETGQTCQSAVLTIKVQE
jgi:hypothetical protein